MIDILFHISHGFTARMLTQTDLLGKLSKQGLKVAVVCTDENDPMLKEYCLNNQISITEFNEPKLLKNEQYMFKRKYYLEDLKANPALWEKHIYGTKYNRSRNPFMHVWPRWYRLIYALIPYFPSIRLNFIKKETKFLKSQNASELLKKLNPKKYVSTYPVTFYEAVFLHEARKLKIETWIELLSWDNISCKGRFPALSDKYISWGPVMTQELKEYYQIQDENIFECGVPHFDAHSNGNVKNISIEDPIRKLNLTDPIIFFAMSSPRFAPYEIDIVENLVRNFDSRGVKNHQFIIRPHPQNMTKQMGDISWLDRLKILNDLPHVYVDYPTLHSSKINWSMDLKDMERLVNYIAISDIIINSGSTFSIDALMQNKPVIISSFDAEKKLPYWRSARRLIDYRHLSKLISFKGIPVAKSQNELNSLIDKFLSNPNYLYDERIHTKRMFVHEGDCATEKVVSVLH